MNVLEVDNIEVVFGKNSILNAVYFKAETGKITGVLGSNGCGKTSLLRIIFGEYIPKNKLIRIDSKPILKPLYKNHSIQYLPQFNFIPNRFSLKKTFYLYNLNFSEFVKLFSEFVNFEHTKLHELSGGERRLIEVYVTLKSNTEIILLDEPFSYLSPIYNEILKKIIQEEKENKIIIVTDHMYQNILDISDDVYLLKDGWGKQIKSHEELVRYNYIRSL
tara:strand:+ start:2075 stop:2731 length:657 start_codon:yes stop_codon:yes gene_type:complete